MRETLSVRHAESDIDRTINIDSMAVPSHIGIMQYRLQDVIVATMRLGSMDNEAGMLVLADHEVEEIVPTASFEEVAHHLSITAAANDSNSHARVATFARDTSSLSRGSAAVCINSRHSGDQCSRGATILLSPPLNCRGREPSAAGFAGMLSNSQTQAIATRGARRASTQQRLGTNSQGR